MDREKFYKNFLNAYWLRPETALWRALDVESMKNFEFVSPSLDLGCGDGTFSFLRAGGEFDEKFDVFKDVDNLDNFFDNVDVYDSYHGEQEVRIIKKPEYQIDYALDHKNTLLIKAKRLGLYKNLVEADANNILPFENDSFQSVFSNIIYWLNDPKQVFTEIYRILSRGGMCCVMVPDSRYLEGSFYYSLYETKNRPDNMKFLELIDRGRVSDNLKIIKTYDEWRKIICDAGFEIKECIPHLSKTVIQMWDIGLRPIFPMLKKMTQHLTDDIVIDIKKEWIDLFQKIGNAIIENDLQLMDKNQFCFYCFILVKR